MIIANNLGNARFRVLSKETSACFPEASTKTKKYWKGPEGGMIGLHRSPWRCSRGGGSSLGSFHYEACRVNLPWVHALHLGVCSASRLECMYPSSSGIMRLSMVAPGWPSLPCHSPDLLGVSPINTASTLCVLVLQFATTGTLWGVCLQLGASDSTGAFRPRLASDSVLNLFRSNPVGGTESWFNRAGT